MCLIVVSDDGKLLDEDRFKASHTHNPDGMGLMFVDGGRVHAFKTMDPLEKKLAHYHELVKDRPHVLHHRFATHGSKTLAMCHPFKVLDKDHHGIDLFMMHNGVLAGDVPVHRKNKSDTWHFVRDFLKPVLTKHPTMLRNRGFRRLLSGFIGNSNKLVFMDSDGLINIINPQAGDWKDGFWFSNTYSLAGTQRFSTPKNNYYGGYYGRFDDDVPFYQPEAAVSSSVSNTTPTVVAPTSTAVALREPDFEQRAEMALMRMAAEDLDDPTTLMAFRSVVGGFTWEKLSEISWNIVEVLAKFTYLNCRTRL